MYSGDDDYIDKVSKNFYVGNLIEAVHNMDVGGLKARRFIAGVKEAIRNSWFYVPLPGKDLLNSPGEHAYTVVPTRSGFYVLIYFAPQGGYEKYAKSYDQMVSSFEAIKDGPGGMPIPGKTATAANPNDILNQQVSQFQSQKDMLFGPLVTVTMDKPAGMGPISVDVSGWFGDTPLLMEKKIIIYVSSMTPPPAIPDEATRDFVKAGTFMKEAKELSDYQLAIDAYEKALFNAPWWGDAYYNLGMAFKAAGRYDDAMESMNLYLLTNPPTAAKDKKIVYAIEAEQEKAVKANEAMRSKYGANDGSNGFSFDSLYRYGGIVQDVSFNTGSNAKTVSLKITTAKENGHLVDYLAIIDMTSQSDIFGRTFNADWRGEQNFELDDRHPGSETMTMTVTSFGDGDAKISIRPMNNASASIEANLSDIYRERARQAVYAGHEFKIGDRKFYQIGQGGAKGSLLFFPKEIKDKLEHGEVRDLSPMFVANVSNHSDKYTQSDLGVLDGTHYYLQYEGGWWVPKVGQGPDN
jgi:tetratricopeptide (TPR) repeat protein